MYFKSILLSSFCADPVRCTGPSHNVDHEQQHKEFIEAIRETAMSRLQFEDELPPSFDGGTGREPAGCKHVATSGHMSLLDLTQYGWRIDCMF